VSIGRFAGGSRTAQVESQDAVVAAEIGDLPLPEAGRDRPARKQEDGLARAMLLVVERYTVGQLKVGHG